MTASQPSSRSKRGALLGRDDTDRRAAAVQHVLRRVRADAAGRAPHQHRLALRHLRAVRAHDHAVARAVAQRVARRLFPREVLRLRHQLVGLDDGDLGEPAEVRLEAPDALVRRHHRVVVRATGPGRRRGGSAPSPRRPASSCARPNRRAARPRPRPSPSRGTAGRGARPTPTRGRAASGTRTSAAARRSTSRPC